MSSTPPPGSRTWQPGLKPIPAGICAVLPADTESQPLGDLREYTGWNMSEVNGFRFRTTWARISGNARGQYDWSRIDQLQQLCADNGKFYTINLAAGINTNTDLTVPSWVYAAGATQYNLHDGSGTIPVPWETGYQGLYFEFLGAFAARYGSDPNMRGIIPCGFMQSASMALGDATDEDPVLGMPHVGYPDVDTAYIAGAEAILAQYAFLFKTTSFMLTNAQVFPTTTGGQIRAQVIQWLNDTYGVRGGTMSTSLSAVLPPHSTTRPTVVSGRQSLQPCLINGVVNHALYQPDNPSATFPQILDDLLKHALDTGGHYVEVYQPDLQDPRGWETLALDGAALRANVPLLV